MTARKKQKSLRLYRVTEGSPEDCRLLTKTRDKMTLETHTMKIRSNDNGVSQRRIPWFAIAIALTVAVSGFGRFASAQEPAPRAQQPASPAKKTGKEAASRKRDLIDDEDLFTVEPKIAPFAFTYPKPKDIDTTIYSMAATDKLINKYVEAAGAYSGLISKYQDFDWDFKFKPSFTQTPGAFGVGGGLGSGAGAGFGYGLGKAVGDSQAADDDPCEFKIEVIVDAGLIAPEVKHSQSPVGSRQGKTADCFDRMIG